MRMFRNKQQIFNCLDLWLNIFDIFTFFICLILFEAATKNPCYFCPYSFCYELSFLCFFPFDNSMCHWIDLLDLWVFAWTLFLFLLFYSIPFIPISTTLPSLPKLIFELQKDESLTKFMEFSIIKMNIPLNASPDRHFNLYLNIKEQQQY